MSVRPPIPAADFGPISDGSRIIGDAIATGQVTNHLNPILDVSIAGPGGTPHRVADVIGRFLDSGYLPADLLAAGTEKDPRGLDPHAPGAKLDAGKPLPWLCISGFAQALRAVAQVTTKGAEKYTPNGWASVEDGEARYMEAFGRHMLALGAGELVDADTQCMHRPR